MALAYIILYKPILLAMSDHSLNWPENDCQRWLDIPNGIRNQLEYQLCQIKREFVDDIIKHCSDISFCFHKSGWLRCTHPTSPRKWGFSVGLWSKSLFSYEFQFVTNLGSYLVLWTWLSRINWEDRSQMR